MSVSGTPIANFTISARAKQEIANVRAEYDRQFPNDPAEIPGVSWGYRQGTDPEKGFVTVGFYPRSQKREVVHGIQTVSGIDLIFFTTPEFSRKFDGRVLDFSDERGFFLRSLRVSASGPLRNFRRHVPVSIDIHP